MLSSYPKIEAQMMRVLINTSTIDILYSQITTYIPRLVEYSAFEQDILVNAVIIPQNRGANDEGIE